MCDLGKYIIYIMFIFIDLDYPFSFLSIVGISMTMSNVLSRLFKFVVLVSKTTRA